MDQHDEPATVHVAPSRDFRLYVQQDHQPNNADPGKISNTNTTKTYIVSSAVMSLATPVWKILLDPEAQCKEATAEEAYLLDDDPDMLLILLRISHLHSTHYQQCSPSINCYIWQSSVTSMTPSGMSVLGLGNGNSLWNTSQDMKSGFSWRGYLETLSLLRSWLSSLPSRVVPTSPATALLRVGNDRTGPCHQESSASR